ncbi:MAG: hypothetical protein LLG15_05900 [Betaproteobacteria bacterium]|nr:hypothetical protein [Betaproteobacteria bacterium]
MATEEITKLEKFAATPFRQDIELQHVDHEAGFSTLRTRIREAKRFTIFDIDAHTAEHWGRALLEWAEAHKVEGASK